MRRLLAVTLLLTACASSDDAERAIKLDIPAELEAIQPIRAKRAFNRVSKKPLTLGDYKIVDHKRGWTRHDESSAMAATPELEATRERGAYRFRVEGAGSTPLAVQCHTNAHGFSVDNRRVDVEVKTDERLDCTMKSESGGREWKLALKNAGALLTGDLMSGDEAILVRPVTAQAGPLTIPGGFVFSIERQPVAALSIIEPGSIRLDPTLTGDRRDAVAGAAAALLLLER